MKSSSEVDAVASRDSGEEGLHKWHTLTSEEALAAFGSRRERLTTDEVGRQRMKEGPNALHLLSIAFIPLLGLEMMKVWKGCKKRSEAIIVGGDRNQPG
jgi:hypothetical protein